MLTQAAGGAYRRLSTDRVAMFLGAVYAGVPDGSNAQLVLPPLPGQTERTTYQGTFDNVKYLDYGKPSGSGSIMFANGNMYTGPIMEGPGGSFMPVPMAGELLVRPGGPGAGQAECIYKGEFDNQGRPDGAQPPSFLLAHVARSDLRRCARRGGQAGARERRSGGARRHVQRRRAVDRMGSVDVWVRAALAWECRACGGRLIVYSGNLSVRIERPLCFWNDRRCTISLVTAPCLIPKCLATLLRVATIIL